MPLGKAVSKTLDDATLDILNEIFDYLSNEDRAARKKELAKELYGLYTELRSHEVKVMTLISEIENRLGKIKKINEGSYE